MLPLRLTWSQYMSKNTLDTDDGVQAMERLKSVILLVVIGLTTRPVFAQQPASSAPPQAYVAVVGDVERCQNYPIPVDSALTVQQAVQNAGMVSDIVNVKVIRATQDCAQFTQVISANSADKGEPVEDGDVLLVQSMSAMKSEVRKNAALRTDTGVVVVALEDEGIRIGDVLLYARTTLPADGQVKVISRFQGQPPIAKAELFSPTVHGDVISVSHDNRRVLNGFGNMAPSFSEWKNQTALLPMPLADAKSSDFGAAISLTDVPLNGQSFELPTSPADTMFPPVHGDQPPQSSASAADAEVASSTPINALPISQSEDVADITNETPGDGKIAFASESTAAAPIAPAEIKTGVVAATRSSGFNLWNLVFVGGLLLAGTLILAGTLRPDPDDNSQFIETAARQSIASSKRLNPAATAQSTSVASPIRQTNLNAALPTEKPDAMKKPQVAPADSESDQPANPPSAAPIATANNLVANHEWFSGDWNGQVVRSNEVRISPTASVDSVVHGDTSKTSALQNCSGEMQTTEVSTKSVQQELSAVSVEVNKTSKIENASANADIIANEDTVSNRNEEQTATSALEDLLQNRLPVDLCDAQLPLRIALFGTPTGPRRLRIDAAHKTVPSPHVNLTAEKRREQQVTEAASSSTNQAKADSSGGLDRALHFLQERTES